MGPSFVLRVNPSLASAGLQEYRGCFFLKIWKQFLHMHFYSSALKRQFLLTLALQIQVVAENKALANLTHPIKRSLSLSAQSIEMLLFLFQNFSARTVFSFVERALV